MCLATSHLDFVHFRRCDPLTGTVELPGRELCQITRSPCKIVESVQPWPSFLLCNDSHFVPGCKVSTLTIAVTHIMGFLFTEA